MADLPAIDHGLMIEHLNAHEGGIHKLKSYQGMVTNNDLRDIIHLQENIMRTHVWIMLAFIHPDYHQDIELPPLSTDSKKQYVEKEGSAGTDLNKWIALEAHNTAKNMSNTNFHSALMMKDPKVKKAHIQMALQQLEIKDKYEDFLKGMGWDFVSNISVQERIKTYLHFQHLLNL
ncbi:hypothetical protein ACFSTA_02955 [Ornithinibacillus salinisoli]|uniref:Spore coat protein n=1 Tax=Ornithinibacillus salinisoli TaxID=1848459 RepID=A0ABW4VUN8_9BACI